MRDKRMKLGTLKGRNKDGRLIVVSEDLKRAITVEHIAETLIDAIASWSYAEPLLRQIYIDINSGEIQDTFDLDDRLLAAPFPRTYQWLDGSAFVNHGELMVEAFKLEGYPPDRVLPWMYQGASDDFIGPRDDIVLPSEEDNIDFEGEFAVVVDDVPMGTTPSQAAGHIKLIMLLNDVSLRALAPREMATGFGFLQSKPSTSFAPVAVSPDILGAAWSNGRVCLDLNVDWNGTRVGNPNGGEMDFDFAQLIAHAAKTRRLSAGTIIGSGTLSNRDRSRGSATISEKRSIEKIDNGEIKTDFMKFGDRIRMEAFHPDGTSVFGALDQRISSLGATR
jgi:fumarylacetoacetate (FAA) hydrolase